MVEAIPTDAELPNNTKEANAKVSPTENDGANTETPGCVQVIPLFNKCSTQTGGVFAQKTLGFFLSLFLIETWKVMTQSALNGCVSAGIFIILCHK